MKRSRALLLFALVTLAVLALDRVTKNSAIEALSDGSFIAFIPGFMDFVLVYNTGGAFGLFEGGGVMFVGVAVVAVVAILVYLIKSSQRYLPLVFVLSLISAGALGNAYDRATIGAVPDFFHTLFIEFPVFNVADIALTLGELALLIMVAVHWFKPERPAELEAAGEAAEAAEVSEAAEAGAAAELKAAEPGKTEAEPATAKPGEAEAEAAKPE